MGTQQIAMYEASYGPRHKFAQPAPRLLEMSVADVTSLFGMAPTGMWNYDEASGSALDLTGGGNDLTLQAGAGRGPSRLDGLDQVGSVAFGGTGFQAAASGTLEVGVNHFVVAGIADFRKPATGVMICAGKGAVPVSSNIGWDILTFTDGRFQFDIWDGSQHAVVVGANADHTKIGPFPFIAGRVNSGSPICFVMTPLGFATAPLGGFVDITTAGKFTMPGSPGFVSGSYPHFISCASFFIGASADNIFVNKATILAGMQA